MKPLTRKELIHGRNWLGKRSYEEWGEFLDRVWRHGLCKVFGHAKPLQKMDAPNGICSRCRVCL